ncbi:MAG: zinc ribbon domain-containing protein [Clostridia bacterium]|nr:zinc ribbon domain-containing protein [Clostridia bacterium]
MKDRRPRMTALYAAPGSFIKGVETDSDEDRDKASDEEYPNNYKERGEPVFESVYAAPANIETGEDDGSEKGRLRPRHQPPFVMVYAGPDFFKSRADGRNNVTNDLYACPNIGDFADKPEAENKEGEKKEGEKKEGEKKEDENTEQSPELMGLFMPDPGSIGCDTPSCGAESGIGFCPECGTKRHEGDKFCRNCGRRFGA